jgi:hypothetical protein
MAQFRGLVSGGSGGTEEIAHALKATRRVKAAVDNDENKT